MGYWPVTIRGMILHALKEHHLLLLHHAISDSQAPFASLLFDPHQLHCGCHSRAAALCLDGASGERAAPDFCLHVRFPSRDLMWEVDVQNFDELII